MKKLLLSIGLVAVCLSLKAQAPTDSYFAGTFLTSQGITYTNANLTNSWATVITTNRANVHSIQLSSTASGLVQFYDCDSTNSPFLGVNFTNASYWTRASYSTNIVVTNISGLTGTTNLWTNSGVYTYFVTNGPNTNALSPTFAGAFSANIALVFNNLSYVFARGITMSSTTNLNYVIGYTP